MAFFWGNLTDLLTNIPFIFLGILGIGFLIGFHELGHFLFCKLFGIKTPSFSIGFGPTLIEKKIADTQFQLAAIPLGGYVEIAGMAEIGQGEQHEAGRRDKHSFASKPYYQKLLVMFGGILFNLLFAYLAFIFLFALGIPKTPLLYPLMGTTTIEIVQENSAAALADLQPGDTILGVEREDISDISALLKKISELRDKNIVLHIKRNNTEFDRAVNLAGSPDPKLKGRLGVQFVLNDIPAKGFIEAISSGISATNLLIAQTCSIFVNIFKKRTTDGLGGPLMIIIQMVKSAQQGLSVWLLLLALISINLAVLNLIPLPILDGGQILFYTIEAAIGRPLHEKIRLGIHYVSWILILLLLVYLTIKDTSSLFSLFCGPK